MSVSNLRAKAADHKVSLGTSLLANKEKHGGSLDLEGNIRSLLADGLLPQTTEQDIQDFLGNSHAVDFTKDMLSRTIGRSPEDLENSM